MYFKRIFMYRSCVVRYILSTAVAAARCSQTSVRVTAIPKSALDQNEARECVSDATGDAGNHDRQLRHRGYRGETEKVGSFAESAVDE